MNCQRGITLIEITIALGLMAIVGLVCMQLFKKFNLAFADLNYQFEISELSHQIKTQTDCSITLRKLKQANSGIFPSFGSPVQIYARTGLTLFSGYGEPHSDFEIAQKAPMNWFVLATWANPGIDIKIGKADNTLRHFATHPVLKNKLNFAATRHDIFKSTSFCLEGTQNNVSFLNTSTTNGQIATELGIAGPVPSVLKWLHTPIGLTSICHRYCEKQGFVSGWATDLATYYLVNNGNNVTQIDYSSDEQRISCRCVQ